MNRDDAIRLLEAHADAVKGMGATALYLFGSTARNEAATGSDLDVFIDYEPGRSFSLLDLVGIQQFLEEQASLPVDVTTRSSLNPGLRAEIERSAIRIF
ncbi:hypothetical protein SAMN05880582_101243 [Rhizobium sp. RU20A]|uniref:nucleotidyltransferase family protein n=1 Tax=Rhizobium sp. RU20A TaxID=1907412 RepID=UPI00095632D9|nr:nucleotidyltransferase domain-containing protein [Rhizobium sp. RU20A]SIP97760.1 hypothetical protein SAMN05880582_101243 [Rhizobium sp. RU20A]